MAFMEKYSYSLTLIVIFFNVINGVSISGSCGEGQKLRLYRNQWICCYTARCSAGQNFTLCKLDGGHDTCHNCAPGFTVADTIDTSIWEYQIDPCVLVEDCTQYSDQKLKDGKCQCDLTNGYYGRDRNKCGIDDGGCKKPGYQLTIEGECVPCGPDEFKAAANYDLCDPKTRCSLGQEVADEGSTVKDRTCRQSLNTLPTTTAVDKSLKNDHQAPHNVTAPNGGYVVENKEDSSLSIGWILFIALSSAVVIGIVVFLVVRHFRGSKSQTQDHNRDRSRRNCCSNWCHKITNVYNVAGNLQVGDRNTMHAPQQEADEPQEEASLTGLEEDGATSSAQEQTEMDLMVPKESDQYCSVPCEEETQPKEII